MKKIFLYLIPLLMSAVVVSCDSGSDEPEDEGGNGNSATGQEGKNLVSKWKGSGTPAQAGWTETSGVVAWAAPNDATTVGTSRYQTTTTGDVVSFVYLEDDSRVAYVYPELMLRFDNNKYEGTVYYFPTSEKLIKGKQYTFTFDYHVGNGGVRTLIAGVASSTESTRTTDVTGDDGSKISNDTMNDIVGSAEFVTNTTQTNAGRGKLTITAESDAVHYIFFKYKVGSSTSHPWFGVASLDFQIVK